MYTSVHVIIVKKISEYMYYLLETELFFSLFLQDLLKWGQVSQIPQKKYVPGGFNISVNLFIDMYEGETHGNKNLT